MWELKVKVKLFNVYYIKVSHSCHHWKSHILTITFNCFGKYLKHLLCKNCTPDIVEFYRLTSIPPVLAALEGG